MFQNRISIKPFQQSEVGRAVVHGALLVMLRASRALALAPLSITAGADGSTVTLSNMLCRVYGLANTLIIGGLVSATVWALMYGDILHGKHISLYCRIAHSSLAGLITLHYAYSAKARLGATIRNLHLIEKINTELKTTSNERIKIKILLFCLISHFVLYLYLLLVQLYLDSHNASSLALFYALRCFATVRVSLLQAEYVLVVLTINDTLKALNNNLLQLAVHSRLDETQKGMKTPLHATIRFLCLSFATIDDVVKEINKMYGFMTMMSVISYFFYLLEVLYDLIVGLFLQFALSWLLGLVFWFLYNSICLILLLEPCHQIQEQQEEVRYNLGKVLRGTRSFHDQVAFELELFYKQATLNRLTSQPMGLFAVSRSLLIPIAGTISTYLVIAIQLEFF